MSASKWSEVTPTAPGFYWFKSKRGGQYRIVEIVSVGTPPQPMVNQNGSVKPLPKGTDGGWYAGPIPVPQEGGRIEGQPA